MFLLLKKILCYIHMKKIGSCDFFLKNLSMYLTMFHLYRTRKLVANPLLENKCIHMSTW